MTITDLHLLCGLINLGIIIGADFPPDKENDQSNLNYLCMLIFFAIIIIFLGSRYVNR